MHGSGAAVISLAFSCTTLERRGAVQKFKVLRTFKGFNCANGQFKKISAASVDDLLFNALWAVQCNSV